jgi:hypothetical protein
MFIFLCSLIRYTSMTQNLEDTAPDLNGSHKETLKFWRQ